MIPETKILTLHETFEVEIDKRGVFYLQTVLLSRFIEVGLCMIV